MHLGVFGGSFDPVHVGHLAVATAVIDALDLDLLRIIPTADHPFKKGLHVAGPAHRLEMLNLAFRGKPEVAVDAAEVERGGTSYTVATLREIRKQHGRDRLSLIVGADTLTDFGSWREHETILSLAEVVVTTRAGENAENSAGYAVVEVPPVAVSATEVRGRLARGLSVDDMLPPAVLEYIRAHGLYGTGV